MIVVLSYNGDAGTTPVLEWLQRMNQNFMRINLEDEDFHNISVSLGKENKITLILKNGKLLDIANVDYFFYRGGTIPFYLPENNNTDIASDAMETHLRFEYKTLINFFYKEVSKKCLGNLLLNPINKLDQIVYALKIGLKVPETLVCNKNKNLKDFFHSHHSIITKSIQENILPQTLTDCFNLKPEIIDVKEVPDIFFPSLFQEFINKKMEIRTFYLDGCFYSLGMVLNSNMNICDDYRKHTNELRYFRYNLPVQIENKLHKLMRFFKLNIGSIDLILSDDNEYYFLEINPTGQYGWVSDYGNYCIEKKIAEFLVNKTKK
ncbi:MAG TPA: hypothetical protein PKK00_14290 [Bacteroidales bacterium]|nr:hypothetical protein [Bacteroidales bacterium]HPS18357.1 hypothetical protein [Bacteroidales bacterium]